MAAIVDFGKHKGKELKSLSTNYLRYIVKELPQERLAGWKILAQEVLKERKNAEVSKDKVSTSSEIKAEKAALPSAEAFDLPEYDAAKTVVQFGKFKGKELGKIPTGYLRYMAKTLVDGKWQVWGLIARKMLEEKGFDMLELLEAKKVSVRDICTEFGLDNTPCLDTTAYATLLQRCIKSKNYEKGKHLHRHIIEQGLKKQTFLANLVVRMYGVCGKLEDARAAFEAIPNKNTYSWNMIIAAYAQNGLLKEAAEMYESMPEKGVVADTTMITAYSELGDIDQARKIFDEMKEKNVISWSAMISGYAKNGDLQTARALFDEICVKNPNAGTWNAIITGYAQNGDIEEAKKLLAKMPNPTVSSWNSILSAYRRKGMVEEAEEWFTQMPKKDNISSNEMISAYAKAGHLEEANKLFESTDMSSLGSCNAMLSAFVKAGKGDKALKLYSSMRLRGLLIDVNTVVPALSACSSLGKVQWIHGSLKESAIDLESVELNTALICAYGKCGDVETAKSIFEVRKESCVVTDLWNAILAAYNHNERRLESLAVFREMNFLGVKPNETTLMTMISSCSNPEEGRELFWCIKNDFFLEPSVEHYVCMVQLLGRAGKLRKAEELVNNMPFKPCFAAWIGLLHCCKQHNNTKVATRAAIRAIKLEPKNSLPYELLASVLTAAGDKRAAKQVFKRMKERISSSTISVKVKPSSSSSSSNEDESHPSSTGSNEDESNHPSSTGSNEDDSNCSKDVELNVEPSSNEGDNVELKVEFTCNVELSESSSGIE